MHFMLADDVRQAHGVKADFPLRPFADLPDATVPTHVGQILTARGRHGITERQRRARRRIALAVVVRFNDLHVRIHAQHAGRARAQVREQRDADGEVAGEKDRRLGHRVFQRLLVVGREPRRPEHPRFAMPRDPLGNFRDRGAIGEVHAHVHALRVQPGKLDAAVFIGRDDARCKLKSRRRFRDFAQMPTHAAVGADNSHANCGHVSLLVCPSGSARSCR